MEGIDSLRKEIDLINEELIKILERRLELVAEIMQLKEDQKLEVYDPKREQEMIEKLEPLIQNSPQKKELINLFQYIVSSQRGQQ